MCVSSEVIDQLLREARRYAQVTPLQVSLLYQLCDLEQRRGAISATDFRRLVPRPSISLHPPLPVDTTTTHTGSTEKVSGEGGREGGREGGVLTLLSTEGGSRLAETFRATLQVRSWISCWRYVMSMPGVKGHFPLSPSQLREQLLCILLTL